MRAALSAQVQPARPCHTTELVPLIGSMSVSYRIASSSPHAVQPLLVLSVLAVLPGGLHALELGVPCAGPVLEVLTRFRHLQELLITGNGGDITWRPTAQLGCCQSFPNCTWTTATGGSAMSTATSSRERCVPCRRASPACWNQPPACAAWRCASAGMMTRLRCATHCLRW